MSIERVIKDWVWPVIAVLGLASPVTVGDTVERRGTAPPVEGRITVMDDGGVTVRSSLGADHVVPWDRVRRVIPAPQDPQHQRFMAAAVDLWRARSRVQRNDTALAEPLLERLFEQYRGRTHETALVVAEGLLRCRIARADHVRAVIPALEVARLRRSEVATDAYSMLPPVFDADHALCTVLAPAWLPSPLLESLARELESYDAGPDEVVATLAWLYRRSVLSASGTAPAAAVTRDLPDHPGVTLLKLAAECVGAQPQRRPAAREQLARRIPALPAWATAWARYAIGRSLLDEAEIERRQQGLVSLIHVPAQFGESQPYLSGLALAYISIGLEQIGDSQAAAEMRTELQRSYPRHPLYDIGVEQLPVGRPAAPKERPA
jgi:hypothetical protein